jgi:hypothetical protein
MPAEMTEKEKRAIEIFQSNRGDHKGNEAWVRHYLYMDRALDAKRLGSRLANDGFRIKVKRSGDGEKWLVLPLRAAAPFFVVELVALRTNEGRDWLAQDGSESDYSSSRPAAIV